MSLVYAFSGDGKGKTTAAFGTALRAISRKKKVYIVQFLKSKDWFDIGEISVLKNLNGVFIYQFGKKGWVNPKKLTKEDHQVTKEALDKCYEIIEKKKPFLLILDEILVAFLFKLISEKEVLNIIEKSRVNDINLIITGRGISKNIIDACDLVSQMELIKHHYDKGEIALEGLEY